MAFTQPAFGTRTGFPSYGLCDSYFVENHEDDDGLYARAAAERERHRSIAKIRQKALAEELSQQTAREYQMDVLEHMERMEAETLPDVQSIDIQTEIQWFMRPYLLDFLLEAHHAFHLLPETLHLAVNILDRYCSRRVVYKRHYQLVGCASLLIAAKYGDRKDRVPTIRELKSMCCSLYDDDMFTQMEWHVLQTLGWIIGHPTVTSFLDLALTEVAFDPELEHMASYIVELALYHKEFISLRPSVISRSALALARCIINRAQPRFSAWSAQYDPQIVLNLSNHLAQPTQALLKKYASPQFSSVSTTLEIFLARQAALATRVVAPPPSDLQDMDMDLQPPVDHQLLTPQTPQKPGYAFVPQGVLTPPITPDKDYANIAYNSGHCHPALPRIHVPASPTPPPSVEHAGHDHMGHMYYVPQPTYVRWGPL